MSLQKMSRSMGCWEWEDHGIWFTSLSCSYNPSVTPPFYGELLFWSFAHSFRFFLERDTLGKSRAGLIQFSLFSIAQYHKLRICLRELDSLYTYDIPLPGPHIASGKNSQKYKHGKKLRMDRSKRCQSLSRDDTFFYQSHHINQQQPKYLQKLRPRLHDGKMHIFSCVLAFHLHKNGGFIMENDHF